jgi:hypothetical protein
MKGAPLSQSTFADTVSVATTTPTAHRREGCSNKVVNEVLGAVYAGMRLAHRTCYYTDQLSSGERRNEELVRKLLAGLLAAKLPKRH